MMRERKKTEKSRGKEKYTSIHFLFLFKKKTDSIRKRHKVILTRYTIYEVSFCMSQSMIPTCINMPSCTTM